ncbi:MAG: hypothetical protein Q7T11_05445, partial [Deltaproteobacteria bacterium]|nr:hypothetical protein [Deltaproteobacteria bacterium]
MAQTVPIAPAHRAELVQIIHEILESDMETAQAVVEDGRVDATELFDRRHQLKTFPSSRSLERTLGARLYDDKFFQQSGVGKTLFTELVDETFAEAAGMEGSEDAIDTDNEMAWLRENLPQYLTTKKATLLDQLRKKMEKVAASQIQDITVSKTDDIYRVIIRQNNVPASIETFRELFYDNLVDQFPLYVNFFDKPQKITPPRPLPLGVDYLMATAIETPILSNRSAYIGVSLRQETVEGRKIDTITWRQLSEDEEGACGLEPLDTRMAYLVGQTTVEELPNKELSLTIDIQFNPDINGVALFIGSLFSELEDP